MPFLSRIASSKAGSYYLAAIVFGPLLVTAVGLFCVSLGFEQALPPALLSNSYGFQRLTQIFGNPTWVWPYFAPGLAITLWLTIADATWKNRLLWAITSVFLILGIFATQQRGGILLCVVYIVICSVYSLNLGLKKRSLPIIASRYDGISRSGKFDLYSF